MLDVLSEHCWTVEEKDNESQVLLFGLLNTQQYLLQKCETPVHQAKGRDSQKWTVVKCNSAIALEIFGALMKVLLCEVLEVD